jgi:hypothetical protein
MYQPANYALDALQGFKGVQDIYSQQAQDARLAKQSSMQEETHAMDMATKQLALDDARKKVARAVEVELLNKKLNIAGLPDTADPKEIAALQQQIGVVGQLAINGQQAAQRWADPAIPEGNLVQAPGQQDTPEFTPPDFTPQSGVSTGVPSPARVGAGESVTQDGQAYWKKQGDPDYIAAKPLIKQFMPADTFTKIHTDPQTGRQYKVSDVADDFVLSKDGKYLPLLQTTWLDGSPRGVVPRTENGTNNGDDPLKFVNLEDAKDKLRFFQLSLDKAAREGKTTHQAAIELKAQMYADSLSGDDLLALTKHAATKDLDVAAHLQQTKGELEQKAADKARTDRNVKAEVDSVAPKLQEIVNNNGLTQEQKRVMVAPILAGLSRDAAVIVKETHGTIKDLFPEGKDKKYTSVNTANGVFMVNDNNPAEKVRIGASPATAGNKAQGKTEAELRADINASFKDYEALAKAYEKRRLDNKDDEAVQQELTAYKAEVLDPKLEALNGKYAEYAQTTGKVYAPGAVPAKKQAVVEGTGADGKAYTVVDGVMYEKPGGMAAPTQSPRPAQGAGKRLTAETLNLSDPRVQAALRAGRRPEQIADYLNKKNGIQ